MVSWTLHDSGGHYRLTSLGIRLLEPSDGLDGLDGVEPDVQEVVGQGTTIMAPEIRFGIWILYVHPESDIGSVPQLGVALIMSREFQRLLNAGA